MSESKSNIEPDKKTIVTGQQIGLLGGPLYTTYKVLGAVYLAQQSGGRAVYWLETNDADFNEINHIDYLDAEGQLRTLVWDIDTQGYSSGYIEVDGQLTELLETFFSTLRQTEFTPGVKELVLDCYRPGSLLGDASAKLARELFGGFDLEFFTPFQPEFRDFSKKILLKEAERTPEDQQCNLFCMVGKQRKTLFKKNGGYHLRDGTEVDLAEHDLVPNVKTRNVCQDAYFQAHTYVAGPGEIKYIKELGPFYEFHGVNASAVQRRMSISLLEPRVRRLMTKTGLSLEEIMGTGRDELIKKVLKKQSETGFDFNQTLESGMQFTEEYLSKLEGIGFEAPDVKELRKTLRPTMKKVSGKLRAQEKEKHQQLLTNAQVLSDNLNPFGKPQERVFNIFYYMNFFGGVDFIKRVYDNYEPSRKVLEI
ncbi:MAG: bacillithiol biosynthesis BshC [bacterium]|nr:bacillithiol biosynthesis BshC [bacterium]